MRLYVGTPSAIHQHWRYRLEHLEAKTREASRLVVPNKILADQLRQTVPFDMPPLVVLDQWLEQTLPKHITPAPQGTWDFLSSLVPDALVPARYRQTPGFMLSLAGVLKNARDRGLARLSPGQSDRLLWAELSDWVDQKFRGSLADTLRLYDYAIESRKVPTFPGGITFVYGFSAWDALLTRLVASWGSLGSVEIWGLSGLIDADLKRQAESLIRLTSDGPDGVHHWCRLRPDEDAWDMVARMLWSESLASRGIVVGSDLSSQALYTRALVRHQVVSESYALQTVENAWWNLFCTLVDDKGQPNMVRRWSELTGSGPEWISHWKKRLESLKSWRAFSALIQEALALGGMVASPLERWAQDLGAFDEWAPPSERVARDVMKSFPHSQTVSGPLTMAPSLAVWVPGVNPIWGPWSTPPSHRSPFDRDEAIRGWISQTDPAYGERRVIKAWRDDPKATHWIVAEKSPEKSQEFTVPSDTRADVGDGSRIRAWYETWHNVDPPQAWWGHIGTEAVPTLMPQRLSPSALEDFGRCPLSFLFARVLRIKERLDEESLEVAPWLLGQWAHAALEAMVVKRRPLTLDNVRESVRGAMSHHPPSSAVPPFYLTYQMLKLSSELYEALLRDGWHPGMRTEVEVEVAWEWVWPIRGRVDRMDWLNDETIRLVDYKTGHLSNPLKISPANLQLALYQKMLSEQYRAPVEAELYGVSQRSEFWHRRLSFSEGQARWPIVEKIAQGMRQRMDQGQFYPVPDPSVDPCRACTYQLVCPTEVKESSARYHAHHPEYGALWRDLKDDSHDAKG